MNFTEQLKLQRLRRFEEESRVHDRALGAHLRLLESVVVNANDGVLITEGVVDEFGPRVQYVNPAFVRMSGYSPDDIVGRTPEVLYGPATSPTVLAKIRSALQERRALEVELVSYHKDGSTYWVEASISPVLDDTQTLTHWVAVLRDITGRKANEEMAVRTRLAELHNEQLNAEIAERKRAEAQLAHAAFHDSLTGLKNRDYFLQRLNDALKHVHTRETFRSFVVYLDLDGFKAINDGMGHRVGDQVLVEIAERLQHCSRPQDTVCRYGGDEFTLLLDDVKSMSQAFAVAQRILDELNQPLTVGEGKLSVSASIGLCELEKRYEQPEDVLRDADTAMYRAKKQGGSRYVAFSEEMHLKALATMEAKLQFKQAFQHQQFTLFYQPVVEIRTKKITAVEALVRWPHPDRGIIPPSEIIPLAESAGLMVPLGVWILRRACRQVKTWAEALDIDPLVVSVNISSAQLEDPAFVPTLVGIIAETGIDGRWLQLEIMELALLQDRVRVDAICDELRRMGIRIALDDFGTGYSSLSHLESYPIDTLKLDQVLVRRLSYGANKAAMVRMVMNMAADLGLEVCAEGVEDPIQAETLRDLGCNLAQGSLYSLPLSAEEMTVALQHGSYGRAPRMRAKSARYGKPEEIAGSIG